MTAEHEQGSLLLQINTVDVAADLATDVHLASGNLFVRPVWKVVYDVLDGRLRLRLRLSHGVTKDYRDCRKYSARFGHSIHN